MSNDNHLRHWPIQLAIVPVKAPYFQGCDLLLAAVCTGFAGLEIQDRYMQDRTTLITCPKYDPQAFGENLQDKICAILRENDIRSLTLLRMHVQCCKELEIIARQALAESGRQIPFKVVVFDRSGATQE